MNNHKLSLTITLLLFAMLPFASFADDDNDEKRFVSSGAKIISGKRFNTDAFTPPKWVTERSNLMYEMNIFRTPSLSGYEQPGTFRAAAESVFQ